MKVSLNILLLIVIPNANVFVSSKTYFIIAIYFAWSVRISYFHLSNITCAITGIIEFSTEILQDKAVTFQETFLFFYRKRNVIDRHTKLLHRDTRNCYVIRNITLSVVDQLSFYRTVVFYVGRSLLYLFKTKEKSHQVQKRRS